MGEGGREGGEGRGGEGRGGEGREKRKQDKSLSYTEQQRSVCGSEFNVFCGGRGRGGGGRSLLTHNSSLEGDTELNFSPFCSP